MKHRQIALIPDENFHGGHVCLVAAEAASNFLFVEEYAPNRNTETWTTAIEQSMAGLPITVMLLSSDQAKATKSIARSVETIKDMTHEMVTSTTRQVEDGAMIRSTVESVSAMVAEMFDNMEKRRAQSAEVVKELESMKNLTCQI